MPKENSNPDQGKEVDLSMRVMGLLAELYQKAPEACNELLTAKVEVPSTLSDDFIGKQVRGKTYLTTLSLLNSVLVLGKLPRIAAVIDDNDKMVGFTQNFTPLPPAKHAVPPAGDPSSPTTP